MLLGEHGAHQTSGRRPVAETSRHFAAAARSLLSGSTALLDHSFRQWQNGETPNAGMWAEGLSATGWTGGSALVAEIPPRLLRKPARPSRRYVHAAGTVTRQREPGIEIDVGAFPVTPNFLIPQSRCGKPATADERWMWMVKTVRCLWRRVIIALTKSKATVPAN